MASLQPLTALILYTALLMPGLLDSPFHSFGRSVVSALDNDDSDCVILDAFRNSSYNNYCSCYKGDRGRTCSTRSSPTTLVCEKLTTLERVENVTDFVVCLRISDSASIGRLSRTMMAAFPTLTGLFIERSALQSIDDDAFLSTSGLQYVNLDENSLRIFPSLESLTDLLHISINENQIAEIPEDAFRNTNKLQKISFENNLIKSLTGSLLANKCSLVDVDFSHNGITRVDDSVFEGTPIRSMDFAHTEITRLPVTQSIRTYLEELYVDGSKQLKDIEFFRNDQEFKNQTFPLLRSALLPYHAQCCHLMRGGHTQFGFGRAKRAASSLLQRVGSHLLKFAVGQSITKRVLRRSTDSPMYTCLNVTSQQCIDDVTTVNVSDSEIVSVIGQEEFCNISRLPCLTCVQNVCEKNCTNENATLDSSVTNTTILCISSSSNSSSTVVNISPTQSSSYSTQMAPVSTLHVTHTSSSLYMVSPSPASTPSPVVLPSPASTPSPVVLPSPVSTPSLVVSPSPASTPSPVSTPSCLNRPSISTTIISCTPTPSPPTTPPLPLPCDSNYCDDTPGLSAGKRDVCSECKPSRCEPPQPFLGSSFCDDFRDVIGFCECYDRKKRDAVPPTRIKRESESNDNCTEVVSVICANCTALEVLPSDWFYLTNNSQLACIVQNSSNSTDTTTTESTTTNSAATMDPNVQLLCNVRNISRLSPHQNTTCTPTPDAFNPCVDLLNEDNSLRIAIWFVIILALIGNLMVIFVFIFYTLIIRRAKMDYFVMHFFYFNLAIADFLMCIYLMAIAVEDLITLGDFSAYDIQWRTGGGCQFAGFVAILSTVVSVYVLTVITLERGYTIINAMHKRKVSKRVAAVLMGIGWALGILIAVLPVTGEVSDYGSVSICLPFRVTSPLDQSYVVFLLAATGLAFIVIALTYIFIFSHIFCKRSSLSHSSSSRRKTEIKVAIRMFVLVFTNFLCWFPIALVGLASVFGDGIVEDINFAKWAVIFIFPINSCLNPILYSLSTKAFRENLIIVLSKMKLFEDTAQSIARSRAGITPSTTSDGRSIPGRRPSIIQRMRLLSISSHGSMMPGGGRRDSNLSQLSDPEPYYRFSLLGRRRRSSLMSDSSNDDSLNGRNDLCRGSSGTLIDDTIVNPNFRSTSPVNLTPNENANLRVIRAGNKISVSSLGPLPEENELVMPTTFNESNIVKLNPAYVEEDDTNTVTRDETRLDVTRDDSQECPQHQIRADIPPSENDSGHSGNYSNSPSVEEFDANHRKEIVHKEIDFD